MGPTPPRLIPTLDPAKVAADLVNAIGERARGFRVESICRVLSEHGVQVAPRTYRNWKTATPSARTITDAHFTDALRANLGTPEGLYGGAR